MDLLLDIHGEWEGGGREWLRIFRSYVFRVILFNFVEIKLLWKKKGRSLKDCSSFIDFTFSFGYNYYIIVVFFFTSFFCDSFGTA